MERLWAPWRLQYIDSDRKSGCVFCEQPQLGDDRKALIVHRGAHAYVILNAYPYNSGHVLVTPYDHVASLEELPKETLHEIIELTQLSSKALNKCFNPDGINAGLNLGSAAGAGIAEHLHMHLVPRWAGDTNFMPVLADVRIMPQFLDQSYQQLSKVFAELTADTK